MKINREFSSMLMPPVTDEVNINKMSFEMLEWCKRADTVESSAQYYLAKLGLLDLCNRLWDFYRFVKIDQTIDLLGNLVK